MGIFQNEIKRLRKKKRLERITVRTEGLLKNLPVEVALKTRPDEGETEREFRDRVIRLRANICDQIANEIEGKTNLFSTEEMGSLIKVIINDPYPEYWQAVETAYRNNPDQFSEDEQKIIKREIALRSRINA